MDGCRCPLTGAIVPWAESMVDEFGRSYTEVTPSGAGLRLWLLVRNPPMGIPKIAVPVDAPPGVDKKPEIQTFGCGPACFVTVTANRLPGTGMIEVVDDLELWMKHWNVTEHAPVESSTTQGVELTDVLAPRVDQRYFLT